MDDEKGGSMSGNNLTWETIFGQVVSKANNYQVGDSGGSKHIMKSPEIRAYEKSFLKQCSIYKGRLINCRFTLYLRVFERSNAYDLDNALKTILDCLQYAKAITNDNLCIKIVAEKYINPRQPRIEYAIQPIIENLF